MNRIEAGGAAAAAVCRALAMKGESRTARRHLLFVCTANQQRSPTAEGLFRGHPDCEARSCGVHALAARPCTAELVDWADVILCMEDLHRDEVLRQFPSAVRKRIVVLDVADVYYRDDPRLVLALRAKLGEWMAPEAARGRGGAAP